MSVPASAWVTVDTVQRSSIGALVEGLEPWLQLALFLLHESGRPASPWRAYLDTLPQTGGAPLFWSDAELRELQGTQVLLSVRGYRRGPPRPEGAFKTQSLCRAGEDVLSKHGVVAHASGRGKAHSRY